ncbi:chromosome transmission fidelity protein 18-like protein isoform X2 [Huso huso]|uniref:Chromosome transmission fidelity protein 18-like protein isoform X2 n=1 Tax=Huso huso TaxID=61971 RepID=A0ABR0ZAH7_HUSHU
MDEYDEMYGIEDEFEDQFADELDAMAEMADWPPVLTKTSKLRNSKETFEEAIAAGDSTVRNSTTVKNKPNSSKPASQKTDSSGKSRDQDPPKKADDAQLHLSEDEELPGQLQDYEPPLTPKPKRQRLDAVKKLDFGLVNSGPLDDITPPSSPESYSRRSELRSEKDPSSELLNISDMAPLQETPLKVEQKRVLKRPPILEDYINVTSTDGSRVFLVLKDDCTRTGVELPDTGFGWNGRRQLQLLGVPFSYLKEQVAEERHRQVIEESQKLTELLSSQIDKEFGETESEVRNEKSDNEDDSEDENEENQESSACRLWVDKFTPRHYTELLSDDFTNRCLLKWLKMWDVVVFGKEKPVKKIKSAVPDNRHPFKQQSEQQNQKWKSKSQITEEILEADLDQQNRPKYKVALLCGPPGLGKTTLAHIIAKHAGYNVVEMNASDDRSQELFQKRIDTATQMKSVLGANEKPNCLIIDEIDGAPTAAINVLLSIINRKDTKEMESGGNTLKKKKKKESLLLRPIICICNDLYAPALRQLRQQAFVLTFPQTLPSRLVQRLCEIAKRQGMNADTGALMALCEKTENDIRSCVNTLQFLHGRGKKELSMKVVETMKIGLKDQNKGLFTVWQEIFQLPRIKRKRIDQDPFLSDPVLGGEGGERGGVAGRGQNSATAQRFYDALHLTTSTGEHEKVTQGLYDNFLNMKFKDPYLSAVCLALEWLEFTDMLNETIMHGQNFTLMRYLPFLPVTFHLLFAASSVPRIAYPKSNYEAQTKKFQMQNLLTAMISEIHPSIRSRLAVHSLSLEVLCPLLQIISPKLRPVNPQLYSTREKQQLVDLIGTMLSYNLTYRQERTPEGQYVYQLDPNVEEICRFPSLPPRKQMTYQAKQMIAREIDVEKMRRTESMLQARNANRITEEKQQVDEKTSKEAEAKSTVRNHQQRLENIVKQAAVEERPEVDFFGRAILKKKVTLSTTAGAEPGKECIEQQIGKAVGTSDVWFRFNEGVSNAVRRNVYIKDLL